MNFNQRLQLNQLNFIMKLKFLPQFKTKEFKLELERILLKVNEKTVNTYNEVYQSINKATQEYNTILTNIQNGEESFVNSIKQLQVILMKILLTKIKIIQRNYLKHRQIFLMM